VLSLDAFGIAEAMPRPNFEGRNNPTQPIERRASPPGQHTPTLSVRARVTDLTQNPAFAQKSRVRMVCTTVQKRSSGRGR
jgi:hypothetical protein